METLQGFVPGELNWQGAGVSPRKYAGCLGNAMNVTVLTYLFPNLLFAAGLISIDTMLVLDEQLVSRAGACSCCMVNS